MKNRTALICVELAIMLVVFALSAAACIGIFGWAQEASLESGQRDRAYIQLQTAAEILKASKGDMESAAAICGGSCSQNEWTAFWDGDWNLSQQDGQFCLRAVPVDTGFDLLGGAKLELRAKSGTVLAELQVFWQEVQP